MDGPVTVGFDGSPQALAAAEWAVDEAALRGVPLELLQAWPWAAPHLLGTPDAVAEGRSRLTSAERGLRALLPGVEVRPVQMPVSAEDALVAASRTSSLLVLGSRALTTLRGFLVGSVAQHVLARTACPTVLVRAPVADAPPPAPGIVLGLDPRSPCDDLLAFAFDTARRRELPLRVVHAWQPARAAQYLAPTAVAGIEDEIAGVEQQQFDDLVGAWSEKYPDVGCTATLLRGSAASTLLEAADRPSLLVVGRRSRRGAPGPHIGHVTHAAVHHARCPVAVVPHE
ncbi:universal stress protein [Kitasatospora terrestris]|uniref:Universal stress protein n=1 Tax=Kitasatospora terrestris TaxID=258051 RepID=A0ABP9DFR6_9ACTN